ncbi:MAG: hypothetical protein WAK17_06085 [Candidatus Nitrosopolaris sp.]|jgi:hypothetical protein
MTDKNKILDSVGNRGYTASQFEDGVIAGKKKIACIDCIRDVLEEMMHYFDSLRDVLTLFC